MNSTRSPIRVLIADDHSIVREGLAAVISCSKEMLVVGEASNGQEAIDLYSKRQPDVVLMDLHMPVMGGLEALRRIRQQHAKARIIVLTFSEGEEHVFQAIQAGAKGYLLKDVPGQQLRETILAVYEGKTCLPPDVVNKLTQRIGALELTAREKEVLGAIANGMSNQEIGNALFITEGTVKSHVNSILSKMHVTDRTQAVIRAVKSGLVEL